MRLQKNVSKYILNQTLLEIGLVIREDSIVLDRRVYIRITDDIRKIQTSLEIVSAKANMSMPDVIFIRAFSLPRETSLEEIESAMAETLSIEEETILLV